MGRGEVKTINRAHRTEKRVDCQRGAFPVLTTIQVYRQRSLRKEDETKGEKFHDGYRKRERSRIETKKTQILQRGNSAPLAVTRREDRNTNRRGVERIKPRRRATGGTCKKMTNTSKDGLKNQERKRLLRKGKA